MVMYNEAFSKMIFLIKKTLLFAFLKRDQGRNSHPEQALLLHFRRRAAVGILAISAILLTSSGARRQTVLETVPADEPAVATCKPPVLLGRLAS